jgi:hypothetical protein
MIQIEKKPNKTGGEGGIRTLGTGYPVRQISNLVPSTTRPPLRGLERGPRGAKYLRTHRLTGNLALNGAGCAVVSPVFRRATAPTTAL